MKGFKLYITTLFFCFIGSTFLLKAQMKSCCDADSVEYKSTIMQTEGTIRMISILDSIGRSANPEDFYLMNSARAALIKEKLSTETDLAKRINYYFKYCEETLNAGNTDKAITVLKQLMNEMGVTEQNFEIQHKVLFDLLAIAYMRKGELENCSINHTAQSCIIPFQNEAVHQYTTGSLKAIEIFKLILNKYPDDLQSRYLINIAYMTLGKYPNEVPDNWLIDLKTKEKANSNIVLKDIAAQKGVNMNGISGGCIVEDLDNDGLLDIIASSYGLSDQIRYLRQQKDGTFKNETSSSGLVGLTGGLNLIHADFNNDGFADFIILRGGWLGMNGKYPFSLIKNNGNNTFEDVTIESGLYSPAPTQTAAWGDFNNDGWLDLFVAYENYPCQLFLNKKGKFENVAPSLGLNLTAFAKGCVWGDINNDGFPDLYLSILGAPNKLWLNKPGIIKGERVFEEIAISAGVEQPIFSFPTWFFDFNNDGWLDLYVAGYDLRRLSRVGEDAAIDMLALPAKAEQPKLFLNNGNNTFTDVTKEYGVDQVSYTMGCNFGDIDNDGWLDYYLGTGAPDFTSIVPNKLYRNIAGKKFEDITYVTGTGHIQKGHGVAFADIDGDGDQDIYEVMGGAVEGDKFNNVLFENTSITSNHWIKIKLVGVSSNRSAIGAKVKIKVKLANGDFQEYFHTVSSGGSFGSKPLIINAGIGKAENVEEILIHWPNALHTQQRITNVAMDKEIVIKESSIE